MRLNYVQEYLKGNTLQKLLDESSKLPVEKVIDWLQLTKV
jgi:hypothetical protein